MSSYLYIVGLVSKENDTYKRQAKVLIACIEAGIGELPKETADYFGSSEPHFKLLEEKLKVEIPKSEYNDNMEEGFEILVSDIPEGVEKIRFVLAS